MLSYALLLALTVTVHATSSWLLKESLTKASVENDIAETLEGTDKLDRGKATGQLNDQV